MAAPTTESAAAALPASLAAAEEKQGCPDLTLQLLEKTVANFRIKPAIPKLHRVAQKKYNAFNRNRTAELYTTFFALVGDGIPDYGASARYSEQFTCCAPWPGRTNERPVNGMVAPGATMHGLVRYEYKGNVIEECRLDGREHGLRVVCVQTGDIWIRLFQEGRRLAQIVLSYDGAISANPKPIDEGGLPALMKHLHLIKACFEFR